MSPRDQSGSHLAIGVVWAKNTMAKNTLAKALHVGLYHLNDILATRASSMNLLTSSSYDKLLKLQTKHSERTSDRSRHLLFDCFDGEDVRLHGSQQAI